MLERDSELALLDAGVSMALAGSGGIVVVQGPAGIGKSRILAAVGEPARGESILVLRARGGELERDFAFGVVRQLFEPVLSALGPAELDAVLDLSLIHI